MDVRQEGKEINTECFPEQHAAGDSVRQQRTYPQLTHSTGKDAVVFIHRILCAIPQDHTWRQSPPGSSNLPGPVEQSHRATAGRAGMVSTSGLWVERYTWEQRAWTASSNAVLPEPRSDTVMHPRAELDMAHVMALGRGVLLDPGREGEVDMAEPL